MHQTQEKAMSQFSVHRITNITHEVSRFADFTSHKLVVTDADGREHSVVLYVNGEPLDIPAPTVIDCGWAASQNNPANYQQEVAE